MKVKLQELCVELTFAVKYYALCIFKIRFFPLAQPAERRVRFRDQPAYRNGYIGGFIVNLLSQFGYFVGKIDDAFNVFGSFAW